MFLNAKRKKNVWHFIKIIQSLTRKLIFKRNLRIENIKRKISNIVWKFINRSSKIVRKNVNWNQIIKWRKNKTVSRNWIF